MFTKLALRNVKRQIGNYLIYFVTVSITIALMFSINSMTYCEQIKRMSDNSDNFAAGLIAATVFVAFCTAFVLGYATSFMLKLRRREFGMYLTLGMTKKNIIRLFSCETLLLFFAALLMGVFLGLFLYQGLMALLSILIEVELTISAYSIPGFLQTIAFGAGMFLLSALASVRYLKKVSISELLKDAPQEKTEKHPIVFAFLALLSLGGVLYTLYLEFSSVNSMFQSDSNGANIVFLVPVLGFFIFLFHLFCSRSLVGVLLRRKKYCAKGTNTFVLRQLSGKMRVNSVMFGVLSVLLLFAFLLSNISFASKASNEESVRLECPFEILGRFNMEREHGISIEEGTAIISKYSEIQKKQHYAAYTNNEGFLRDCVPEYKGKTWTDTFVPVSEFNEILKMNGFEPLELNGQYCMVSRYFKAKPEHFKNQILTINGNDYSFHSLNTSYPFYIYGFQYAIVPDEAVLGMQKTSDYMAYDLLEENYDVEGLRKELSFKATDEGTTYDECDFDLRVFYVKFLNNQIGVIIIAMLYISTVFICMALAVLSLKTLSGLKEDKQRYLTLYRLGVTKADQCRALFRQTFSFFLLPFVIPFLMSVPLAAFTCKLFTLQGFQNLIPSAILCTAGIALCMLLIYFLYFTITYKTAKANVIAR